MKANEINGLFTFVILIIFNISMSLILPMGQCDKINSFFNKCTFNSKIIVFISEYIILPVFKVGQLKNTECHHAYWSCEYRKR